MPDLSHLSRKIDNQIFGPAVTIEGGEEPAFRVYRRWGLPDREPERTNAIRAMTDQQRANLIAEIKAERVQGRSISDEEYEQHQARQAEAEALAVEQRARDHQAQSEIFALFGGRDEARASEAARRLAASCGIDLDTDYS